MSDLQNQTPGDTYKGLLQVGDYTDGITNNTGANALQVTDGAGVNTALALSTTRVGVGNNSPQAELDVSGGIEATTLTTSGAVTAGSVSTSGAVTGGSVSTGGAVTAGSIDVSGNVVADEYALDGTGSSSSAVAIHAPATNELAIRTNSTEAMRIDSFGNIGIGIENPNRKIHVHTDTPTTQEISCTSLIGGLALSHATLGHGGDLIGDLELANAIGNIKVRMTADGVSYLTGGNVGIGVESPSAPLEVASTTGGVIMPRMNDSQRDAISSPTNGEMIFNTSTNKLNVYNGTAWRELTDTAV